MSALIPSTPTWDTLRAEWSQAQQMGHQTVLQLAKVGATLNVLKGDTPLREFVPRVGQEIGGMSKSTIHRLIMLAANVPLLEKHRPHSQNEAIRLIQKASRSQFQRDPAAERAIRDEAARARERWAQQAQQSEREQELEARVRELEATVQQQSQRAEALEAHFAKANAGLKGALTEGEFKKLLAVLQPDRDTDPETMRELFEIVKARQALLVSPGTSPDELDHRACLEDQARPMQPQRRAEQRHAKATERKAQHPAEEAEEVTA